MGLYLANYIIIVNGVSAMLLGAYGTVIQGDVN